MCSTHFYKEIWAGLPIFYGLHNIIMLKSIIKARGRSYTKELSNMHLCINKLKICR